MSDIKETPKYGKVLSCSQLSEREYYIDCDLDDYKLIACAGCCSESWFEMQFEEEDLIDKTIVDIKNIGDIDLPESNRQECDQNLLYHIYLKDVEEPLIFYLRNSSNGYYDGWLEIEKGVGKVLY